MGNERWEISRRLRSWNSRNLTIIQDLHLWGQTNFWPTQTTEQPGHKPFVVNVVVVGPFEEEKEGIGITSDAVKVKSEDPDTPGYVRGDRVSMDLIDLGSWVRLPWLAHDETPGLWRFPNIGLIKQSNTHHINRKSLRLVGHMFCLPIGFPINNIISSSALKLPQRLLPSRSSYGRPNDKQPIYQQHTSPLSAVHARSLRDYELLRCDLIVLEWMPKAPIVCCGLVSL